MLKISTLKRSLEKFTFNESASNILIIALVARDGVQCIVCISAAESKLQVYEEESPMTFACNLFNLLKSQGPFFSLFLMRKLLSSGQRWFLRPYFPLIRGMFVFRSGLRFLFGALEVPEPRLFDLLNSMIYDLKRSVDLR